MGDLAFLKRKLWHYFRVVILMPHLFDCEPTATYVFFVISRGLQLRWGLHLFFT